MSQQSAIEWTDHTFNPWWGCFKVSTGCKNCYAETLSERYGHNVWGLNNPRRTFGEKHWLGPIKWNAVAQQTGRRARVFCASMADAFEENPALDAERQKLWTLIEQTPWLDWQLLTKRPQNVLQMVPWTDTWPSNIWIGTSIEDQSAADLRLPFLRQIPAAVHFLSCEPLLGPLDNLDLNEIDWLIAGGESGANARPCNPNWVVTLRDHCRNAGVAFFFKQWGGRTSKSGGRLLDGRTWDEFPATDDVIE